MGSLKSMSDRKLIEDFIKNNINSEMCIRDRELEAPEACDLTVRKEQSKVKPVTGVKS